MHMSPAAEEDSKKERKEGNGVVPGDQDGFRDRGPECERGSEEMAGITGILGGEYAKRWGLGRVIQNHVSLYTRSYPGHSIPLISGHTISPFNQDPDFRKKTATGGSVVGRHISHFIDHHPLSLFFLSCLVFVAYNLFSSFLSISSLHRTASRDRDDDRKCVAEQDVSTAGLTELLVKTLAGSLFCNFNN